MFESVCLGDRLVDQASVGDVHGVGEVRVTSGERLGAVGRDLPDPWEGDVRQGDRRGPRDSSGHVRHAVVHDAVDLVCQWARQLGVGGWAETGLG